MVETTDVLVSYRTDPHVDQVEQGAECAHVMHELIGGVSPEVAFIRLPIVTQVKQLTADGLYAEAIQPWPDANRRHRNERVYSWWVHIW